MLPREQPGGESEQILSAFLVKEGSKIARLAARMATEGLGLTGLGVRKKMRQAYLERTEEAARLLDLYGSEAPTLFGEGQRRHAALRLSQGANLSEVIEESLYLIRSIMDAWGRSRGALPMEVARLLSELLAASAAQTSDVFLTFQRSESAAFREAALLQTIVTNLNEAIFLIERDGVISYVSPVLEAILGYPGQFVVGESILGESNFLRRAELREPTGEPIPPEERPDRRALETRTRQTREAVLFRKPDGSDAILEMDANPIFDEEDEFRGIVVTTRDRTEAYRKQQELEDAYTELRRMHARLLSRTRLEAVGGLAQSAAHALNNQLNVIALRLKKLEALPDAVEEAKGIDRSVREIAELVRKFQELASAPKYRVPRPTDVNSVVTDALALARSELEAARIQVDFHPGDVPPALGDRESLIEFFGALFLGELEAFAEGGSMEISTARSDDRILIRLEDTAPALSEREVEELFEPLAGGATSTRILSLSAGRNSITRWGGEVRVVPRRGIGNRFEIGLPALPPEEVERLRAQPTPAPSKGVENVLVVDDDPDNAEMLATLVEDAGAHARTALTGEQGLRAASELRPDAALIDLLLPDMDGWEVARRLKEAQPGIRVAVVSGLAVGKEEKREGVADEVFRKPVSTDDLLQFLGL